MPRVMNGPYTAQADELFAVFMIGMWLPLHEDPAAVGRGLTRARPSGMSHNAPHRPL
jgi:hypothetical protein